MQNWGFYVLYCVPIVRRIKMDRSGRCWTVGLIVLRFLPAGSEGRVLHRGCFWTCRWKCCCRGRCLDSPLSFQPLLWSPPILQGWRWYFPCWVAAQRCQQGWQGSLTGWGSSSSSCRTTGRNFLRPPIATRISSLINALESSVNMAAKAANSQVHSYPSLRKGLISRYFFKISLQRKKNYPCNPAILWEGLYVTPHSFLITIWKNLEVNVIVPMHKFLVQRNVFEWYRHGWAHWGSWTVAGTPVTLSPPGHCWPWGVLATHQPRIPDTPA